MKTYTDVIQKKEKAKAGIEEPSDKVTDGNTHSFTARLYHSTENGRPSEIPPPVKQITAAFEYRTEPQTQHTV